ncbi:MAG: hypothetical protein A2408_02000 [Candidatus Yonathbacteria bacterium RIFOXYC1_FULL_52_10]|uniref:Uncharacterized protein n=1 Tax=Candidatus Yonathbacteria bacterium RIFOXYD1_FULL_52_36 TaxID=1802730 RepID=A0A1G2SMV8_9BACT|nr:MAG: hypothetical protein A2408_02000 [Candidatus Yonathbacteria bacterium RIFOXYC1_FULL_52_10]OHA86316.1 MAG: hypothetical protein A2591_01920 [Candidatus Yonathbacteria bacterium RIFOXYD1_FULL_52_36]
MGNFMRQNWFQLIVVVLLVMLYVRLGEIKKYTFNNWDTSDAVLNNILDSIDDNGTDIQNSIEDLRIDLNNY